MLETNEKPSFSRYTISSTLGTGGMGTVYKAHHEILDRPVALKVPREEFTRDHVFVERFMREARAMGTLKHPHVVSVYDAGVEHGVPFIAMECVEGQTLAEIIRAGGVIPVDAIARWGWQMADALAYVNQRGVLHRDLKSANVIINRAGAAVITDFGIARLEETSTQITRGMIGTPAYMSPEQARGQPIDARSDLYSLGIILYECLTGTLPFSDENALALLQKVIHEAPPSILPRRPDAPAWLRHIVMRCLDKKPERRYAGGRELADALLPYLGAEDAGKISVTAAAVWRAPADTLVSPPHREAARHFNLAVANLARAIQISGGRVRNTLHDGMTRTWSAFQQRTEMLAEAPASPALLEAAPPQSALTEIVAEPATEPAQSIPRSRRAVVVVLVASIAFSILWGAVFAGDDYDESEIDSWGVAVSPVSPAPPRASEAPLPPQQLSGPGFDTPESAPAAPDPSLAANPSRETPDPGVSSASARRRQLIEQSRPVEIRPLEGTTGSETEVSAPASAVPPRLAVLPSSIWSLKEQTTSRDFERELRALVRAREVAVLAPGYLAAPEAAYVFLVDEAGGRVPHVLAWNDEAWTDLNSGEGFVLTDRGFLPAANASDSSAMPLEAFWVEHAYNGVTRNKKRLGW